MAARTLRVLLVASLFALSVGALAGPSPAAGYFACTPFAVTADDVPQNYADIDGDIAVWRDGRNGTCGAWDIYMYDFATGIERPVTTADKKQQFPRIDGDYVVYQSDEDCLGDGNSNVYLYDIAEDSHMAVCADPSPQYMPDVSGEIIVWTDHRNGNDDIFGYDLVDEAEFEICTEGSYQSDVRIDGDIVVWTDQRNGNADVYAYDLSSDTESDICTDTASQWDPVVEGDTIAWIDGRSGSDAIYVRSIASGIEREVYVSDSDINDLEIGDGVLVWNDGTSGDGDVYAYDLASDRVTRVTDAEDCDGMPAISNGLIVYNHYMDAVGEPDIWATALYDLPTVYTNPAGTSRFDTAVALSQSTFPNGAGMVIIATATNWPDALGASALAGVDGAPILLTGRDALPQCVIDEIGRLGAIDGVIVGGTNAVSAAVEAQLDDLLEGSVTRLGGANRYRTAELIAQAVVLGQGDWDGTAFVTTGMNFPDALSAAPLAAKAGWPIFLSGADGITAETQQAMDDLGVVRLLVLGGTGVVPADIAAQADGVGILEVERLGGLNRYGTAVAVATYGAQTLGMTWNGVAIATGQNYPDALAAGAAQGQRNGLMLLTPSAYLDSAPAAAIAAQKYSIGAVKYVGGLSAVSATVRQQVADILP